MSTRANGTRRRERISTNRITISRSRPNDARITRQHTLGSISLSLLFFRRQDSSSNIRRSRRCGNARGHARSINGFDMCAEYFSLSSGSLARRKLAGTGWFSSNSGISAGNSARTSIETDATTTEILTMTSDTRTGVHFLVRNVLFLPPSLAPTPPPLPHPPSFHPAKSPPRGLIRIYNLDCVATNNPFTRELGPRARIRVACDVRAGR